LLALQSNAIKFTSKGRVEINVRVEKQYRDSFLKVTVLDTGIGIEEEDKDRLFKLFGFVTHSK